MQISRINGITAGADATIAGPDKVQAVFVAGGAIAVGGVVMLPSGETTGKKVIATTTTIANCCNLLRGIYEGVGGTGALATLSGASGRAAVTGDVILVTVYGTAAALVDGTTVACTDNAIMTTSTATAGVLMKQATAVINGVGHPITALAANSGAASGTISNVFVNLM